MSVFVRNSMASAKAEIRETGAKAGESGGMKPRIACKGFYWRMFNLNNVTKVCLQY